MGWKTNNILKKSKQVYFNSSTNIYLPNYTSGAKWHNTNVITAITNINPQNNIFKCSTSSKKNDDNNIVVNKNSYTFTGIKKYNDNVRRFSFNNLDYLSFKVYIDYRGEEHPSNYFLEHSVPLKINNMSIGNIGFEYDFDTFNGGVFFRPFKYKDNYTILYSLDTTYDVIIDGMMVFTLDLKGAIYFCFIGDLGDMSVDINSEYCIFKDIYYGSKNVVSSKNEQGIALFYEQN